MPANSRSVAAFDTRRGAGRCSSGSTPSLRWRPSHASKRNAAPSASRFLANERYVPTGRGAGGGTTARCAAERAPLVDALPRAPQVAGSERSQAAVRRLLMIERRAAAEIAGFDERDPQSAACRLVRAGQAVNAAADDQQVELVRLEPGEIASAHGSAFIL